MCTKVWSMIRDVLLSCTSLNVLVSLIHPLNQHHNDKLSVYVCVCIFTAVHNGRTSGSWSSVYVVWPWSLVGWYACDQIDIIYLSSCSVWSMILVVFVLRSCLMQIMRKFRNEVILSIIWKCVRMCQNVYREGWTIVRSWKARAGSKWKTAPNRAD